MLIEGGYHREYGYEQDDLATPAEVAAVVIFFVVPLVAMLVLGILYG